MIHTVERYGGEVYDDDSIGFLVQGGVAILPGYNEKLRAGKR